MIYTSSLQERWQVVPAPTTPLVQLTPNDCASLSMHTYKYPFTHGRPGGTFEVSNAIVDRSHKVGAWSEPATIVVLTGWHLMARGENQPSHTDDVGIVWKVKCVSLNEPDPLLAYVEGGEYLFVTQKEVDRGDWQSITPYSSVEPQHREIMETTYGILTLDKLNYGGRHAEVAGPPNVYASAMPLLHFKVAYCRITHRGLTALSPALQFTMPTPPDGWTLSYVCRIRFGIQEQHPQGTIGYLLAVQYLDAWHLCRPQGDTMYQVDCKQPVLTGHYGALGQHEAAEIAESYIGKLEVALMDYEEDITIDELETHAFCPIIDRWDSTPATFHRTIAGEGRAKIIVSPIDVGYDYPKNFPTILVYNSYSTWIDIATSNPGSDVSLTFADWSGGQGFGNQFIRCDFDGGLRVREDSTAWIGSHTHSEGYYADCHFRGSVAIWLAGQQTANIRFNHCYAHKSSGGITEERRTCAVYVDQPNKVKFTGGFYPECPGNVIFNVTTADIQIEDCWNDQGAKAFIGVAAGGSVKLKMIGGKINAFTPAGESYTFARITNSKNLCTFILHDVVTQFSGDKYRHYITTGSYDLVDVRTEDSDMCKYIILREPTRAEYQDRLAAIYGVGSIAPTRSKPGYRIEVSATTSDTNTPGVVQVFIPGQVVIANSLTGQSRVSRETWDS